MSSTIALPPIRMSRAQLIEALEGRRSFLAAHDAEVLRQHKAEEVAWLKKYRARLREMLKMPCDTAKHYRQVEWDDGKRWSQPPSCPMPKVRQLDDMLRHLGTVRQDRITLTQGGSWGSAFTLLTFDPTPAPVVC